MLDARIRLPRAKQRHLLLVLDFPAVPLANNLAERDLRVAVVKRKIATGPRPAAGARAWEVFLTLLAPCRQQGLNFFASLCDRISRTHVLPALADLLRARVPTRL
ncbi:MAG: transposase [Ardenticatenaceae bacterium]|nr:transposase [Ardenticatenaceae bacterium]